MYIFKILSTIIECNKRVHASIQTSENVWKRTRLKREKCVFLFCIFFLIDFYLLYLNFLSLIILGFFKAGRESTVFNVFFVTIDQFRIQGIQFCFQKILVH